MTHLLDVNLLVALAWPSHVHHEVARAWFDSARGSGWATCPLTVLGFVRISSNPRAVGADDVVSPEEALALVSGVTTSDDAHVFWPDDLELSSSWSPALVVGHRQVTDAYLARLAQAHGGRLATLDRRLPTVLPAPLRDTIVTVVN